MDTIKTTTNLEESDSCTQPFKRSKVTNTSKGSKTMTICRRFQPGDFATHKEGNGFTSEVLVLSGPNELGQVEIGHDNFIGWGDPKDNYAITFSKLVSISSLLAPSAAPSPSKPS